jgi:hypothetical protein
MPSYTRFILSRGRISLVPDTNTIRTVAYLALYRMSAFRNIVLSGNANVRGSSEDQLYRPRVSQLGQDSKISNRRYHDYNYPNRYSACNVANYDGH